jgi:two-component system chemotaxis response regulator CheY
MANILLVDDSASIRQLASFTLKTSGHQVTEGSNGQEGLDQAKKGNFDVIITDLNMPVLNGVEMTKEIRGLPAYKATPILMLTTESEQGKKEEGKAAGVTGWIVKPFDPDTLLKTVDRVTG